MEGSSMVESMRAMEAQHTEMSARFGLENSKLGDVEQSLKENVDTIAQNMKSIESRMAALGK